MEEVFDAVYASLHVRVSNKGAKHLYTQTLGYECVSSIITVILHCLTIPCLALATFNACFCPACCREDITRQH